MTVSGTVTVSMSASNAQGSPTQFLLKQDNATTLSSQSVAGNTATASWNTTGVPAGSHTLNLTVTDGAGRTAMAAVTVTVSNGGADPTPPTATITSPASGTWTGNSIALSASASDNVAVASLKLWGNGAVIATLPCSGATCSGTVTWVTGPLAPAAYQVQAVAMDAAGNCGLSPAVTINKDATTPVVTSGATCGGAPPPPPALAASITSPASGTWTGNIIALSAGASDNLALSLHDARPIWAVIATLPCSGATCSGTVTWVTGPLAPAAYQVQAVATDTVGNCGLSPAVTINKDATTPVVTSGATCGGAPPPPPALAASSTSPATGMT